MPEFYGLADRVAERLAIELCKSYIKGISNDPHMVSNYYLECHKAIHSDLSKATAVTIKVERTGPVQDLSKIPPVPWEVMG